MPPDLTILIVDENETSGSDEWLPGVMNAAQQLGVAFEIVVMEAAGRAPAAGAADAPMIRLVRQPGVGYGTALREGLAAARGAYIITLNADLSHDPQLIRSLWRARQHGEVVIGSRYTPGGSAAMPLIRHALSRALNVVFRRGLSLPVHDLSSSYRLYQARVVKRLILESADYDILEEILIKCYAEGLALIEIPMQFRPSASGQATAVLRRLGWAYVRTFWRLWRLRNSIQCADYDYRAHDSVIPLQRYWQRRRHALVLAGVDWAGVTLDLGCGSSHILANLHSAIGLDILPGKLRFARRFDHPLVNGSIWALPFPDHSFDCVVCSEVIEHVPAGVQPFLEMRRVLKPGGRLVIGTPDYGPPTWRMIETVYGRVAPGGYAHEHITHYTRASLTALLQQLQFQVERTDYILGSEMILRCRYDGEHAAKQ